MDPEGLYRGQNLVIEDRIDGANNQHTCDLAGYACQCQ